MKLRKILISLAASAVLLASGCQAVPVDVRHIPKDAERLAAAAAPKNVRPQEAKPEYPDRLVIREPIRGEKAEITADAEIVLPETADLPILNVVPDPLTLDECSRYAEVLFSGQDMFVRRADLEESVSAVQEALASGQLGSTEVQNLTEQLQELQHELDSLPAGPVQLKDAAKTGSPDFTWVDVVSDGSDGLYRRLQCVLSPADAMYDLQYTAAENGEPHVGNVWSTSAPASQRSKASDDGSAGPDALADPALSAEQAAEQADVMLSDLGLHDYRLAASDLVFGDINGTMQKAWRLNYTRTVQGVPVTFTALADRDYGSHAALGEDDDLLDIWNAEVLEFLVCDSGIVRLTWKSPFEVAETVAESVPLLPFSEIQAVLEDMMPLEWADPAAGNGQQIVIQQARLGLGRVLDDTGLQGSLVPTWDFFGTVTFTQDGKPLAEQPFRDPDAPLLTVNAVDGTVIPWPGRF